jgi:hypothetical protein
MGEWYYASNNQRLGPVTMEQLKQLAAAGKLTVNDLVWKDGMANWAAASTIPGLFGGAAAAPAPPPAAPRPAAAPGAADEVVALPLGSAGPSIVDLAMLIAKRAVSGDLETLPVADAERSELAAAGVTGETAQRYLVWRRSVLWVALVPLVVSGLALSIDSMVNTFEHLNGLGVLVEIFRILTLLALPAAAAFAALKWNQHSLSTRIATFGFLVAFGVPLLIQFIPPSWISKSENSSPLMVVLFVSLLSIPPGLVRGGLRVRTLLPESVITGMLVVGASLMLSLFFFGSLHDIATFFGTKFLGVVFILCIVLAPLCYVIGAKTFLLPIATPADRKAVATWQWVSYGLCTVAALTGILQLVMTVSESRSMGFYYIWTPFVLFLDFLGRSLFVSVVAAQFVLWLGRAAYVAQQQFGKSEQGATLDRRMSELEPIVGKM